MTLGCERFLITDSSPGKGINQLALISEIRLLFGGLHEEHEDTKFSLGENISTYSDIPGLVSRLYRDILHN